VIKIKKRGSNLLIIISFLSVFALCLVKNKLSRDCITGLKPVDTHNALFPGKKQDYFDFDLFLQMIWNIRDSHPRLEKQPAFQKQ